MFKKITSHLSTASKFKTKKAGYHTLEVVPSQITNVHGKQYPCNNRMGIRSSSLRRFRNAVVIFSLSANATIYFFTFSIFWAVLVVFCSTLMVGIVLYLEYLEQNDFSKKESNNPEQNLRTLFEKYVPAAIITRYLDSEEVDLFQGIGSWVTILFLDIRDFTAISEKMGAKNVVSFLNAYFEKCSHVISEENGHINKYTGDGFLAIFGAPEPLSHHTVCAFNAASRILDLSKDFILGGESIKIGIGLHTGKAILGNIGSKTKIEYTAIGDTVNTAARLEEVTKLFNTFPIVMSQDVRKALALHPHYSFITSLGKQKIRGKEQELEAFGFNSSITSTPPQAQTVDDFLPLQGVGEKCSI